MFMVTARNHIMQSTNIFLSVRYFCTDRRNSWTSFPLICSSWTDNMKITHALGVGGVGHHLPMNNLLLGALPHCIHPKGDAEPLLLPLPSHTAPWPYTAPHRDASGHPASWGRALWGQEGSRGLGSPDPTASCQQGGLSRGRQVPGRQGRT